MLKWSTEIAVPIQCLFDNMAKPTDCFQISTCHSSLITNIDDKNDVSSYRLAERHYRQAGAPNLTVYKCSMLSSVWWQLISLKTGLEDTIHDCLSESIKKSPVQDVSFCVGKKELIALQVTSNQWTALHSTSKGVARLKSIKNDDDNHMCWSFLYLLDVAIQL